MIRVKYNHTKEEARGTVDDAEVVFELLRKEVLEFRDAISERYPKDKINKFNSRSLAKHFLLVNMQLAGQTLMAARQGSTILASHGIRSLVENEINAKYVFAHKDNQTDSHRVDKLASQFLAATRFRSRIKSRFDGKSLRHRAKSVRKLTVYNHHYAELSGYGHSLGVAMALNDEQRFINKTVEYAIFSVSLLNNIIEYVSKTFSFERDSETYDELKRLVDDWNGKYKK